MSAKVEKFLATDPRFSEVEIFFGHPTCQLLEHYWDRAFTLAGEKPPHFNVVTNDAGLTVAEMRMSVIRGLDVWFPDAPEKVEKPSLILNPNKDHRLEPYFGIPTGMVAHEGYLMVTRVYQAFDPGTPDRLYAFRPVRRISVCGRNYQTEFQLPFDTLIQRLSAVSSPPSNSSANQSNRVA